LRYLYILFDKTLKETSTFICETAKEIVLLREFSNTRIAFSELSALFRLLKTNPSMVPVSFTVLNSFSTPQQRCAIVCSEATRLQFQKGESQLLLSRLVQLVQVPSTADLF
jgi:hypothetical protein